MAASGNEDVFTTWTTDLDLASASVVCMCGELDASSAPSFLTDVQDVIKRHRNVIMDVHLLSYADSTGLAAILSVKNALKNAGKSVCLVGCHGLLSKIMTAVRVGDDLPCYEDVEAAVAGIRGL